MFEIFKTPMTVVSLYNLDDTYTSIIASHAKMMRQKYYALICKEGK